MSTSLFTLHQAADWVQGARVVGRGAEAVLRVHTDSRSVQAGDLFVAIKGDTFDGHDFLPQLKAKGVNLAIAWGLGLIVAAIVGVWLLFGKLASAEQDWQALVADMKSSNEHRRGRGAMGLAQALAVDQNRKSEGPRLTTNFLECELKDIRIGMPVEAVYEDITSDITLIQFRPRKA